MGEDLLVSTPDAGSLALDPEPVAKEEEGIPEGSLRYCLYVLFRHKRKALLFCLGMLLPLTLHTILSPSVYRSDAKLLVKVGRENVTLDPTVTTGRVMDLPRTRQSEVNSEVEILQSRDLIEKVVDSIGIDEFLTGKRTGEDAGLDEKGSFIDSIKAWKRSILEVFGWSRAPGELDKRQQAMIREEIVRAIFEKLDISTSKESNIISISYEASSPVVAHDVVSKLITFYLDKHISVHRTPGSYEFFIQQTEQLERSLAKTAAELRDLKNRTGAVSIDEQRRIILGWLAALRQELEQTEAAKAASRAKLENQRELMAKLPETIVTEKTSGLPNPAADKMRERLFELQLKEQDLTSKFTENSLPVQEIRRQISEARALLLKEERTRTETKQGLNTTYQQLQMSLVNEEANMSSLEAKARALQNQVSRAESELKNLNESEILISQLQREMNIQEELYRKNADSLEQARIDQSLEMGKISNISVVEPATYPVRPIGSNRMLKLLTGFLLALFAGVALAFLAEYLDHTLKNPEEIERKLKLRSLVTIPWKKDLKDTETAVRLEQCTGTSQDVPPIGRWEAQYLARHPVDYGSRNLATDSGGWEKVFRSNPKDVKVVRKLLQKRMEGDSLSVGGEEFQGCFEILRDRLFLVNGDLLSVPRAIGISSCYRSEGVTTVAANLAVSLAAESIKGVVLGFARVAGHENAEKRYIVDTHPVGSRDRLHPKAQRSFDLQELDQFVRVLKQHYQFVILDLPPFWEVAAAARIAGLMDMVVWVVEAERVRWEIAQRCKTLLEQAKANIVGVVLNKKKFYIPKRIYELI